jgi:hypothetical protein
MASITLVHPEKNLQIVALQAMNKCKIFQNDPKLLGAPYTVNSSVQVEIFQEFVSALEGKDIKITSTNFPELSQLCEEFGFEDLQTKLWTFHPGQEDTET